LTSPIANYRLPLQSVASVVFLGLVVGPWRSPITAPARSLHVAPSQRQLVPHRQSDASDETTSGRHRWIRHRLCRRWLRYRPGLQPYTLLPIILVAVRLGQPTSTGPWSRQVRHRIREYACL